ncbi:unnamed protein product [Ceratitis capitata]|uniref:(Mediterranean fruit fly) hypothetical protein n=1 Tax=Ceratitis capitata TaxID=7213 RepID=A0A811U0D5_CERCA|nr:unnamed protein product [Ceratitis capitata]
MLMSRNLSTRFKHRGQPSLPQHTVFAQLLLLNFFQQFDFHFFIFAVLTLTIIFIFGKNHTAAHKYILATCTFFFYNTVMLQTLQAKQEGSIVRRKMSKKPVKLHI